jgi:hypothetical protein
LSLDPEAKMWPSGCQSSDQTVWSWAVSIAPAGDSEPTSQ